MPKKMRRGALRSALSERLREGNLIIIDEFGFSSPKTRDFIDAIGGLGLNKETKEPKMLIVDSLDNENLVLSSRNVPKTKVTNSFGLNIYDLLYHEKLLISKAAIEELNALLDPAKGGDEPEEEVKPKAKRAKKADAETAEKKPAKKAKADAEPKAEESTEAVEATGEEATENE